MKRTKRKLGLARETLKTLGPTKLKGAVGGDTAVCHGVCSNALSGCVATGKTCDGCI
jgi:hypothetical protein